ncbi:hypothetical protein [uncultured Thiothrix sp.]|jgi:hypothetical protein|uniref:hypothetical protein n=1 Tax=uncultured Thiothrix sp. TaxID=223185 RepID=UPI002639EAB7|nr:hypothetical protein [uncultured Thiothrix sp.]HMT92454.1 hypothetical protein [Thiolinea sp.]
MDQSLTPESSAVLKHIDMYQSLIMRMAANSAACKQWAVGLVSAILVLVAEKGMVHAAALAIIPAVLFCFLDAYYLALEKQFRSAYNQFINALHAGTLQASELYKVRADGKLPTTFLEALVSWAVWPFYLGMLGLIALAKWLVM